MVGPLPLVPMPFRQVHGRDGNTLLFSTYVGASGLEALKSLALDASGNVYVMGRFMYNNFPKLMPLGGSLTSSRFTSRKSAQTAPRWFMPRCWHSRGQTWTSRRWRRAHPAGLPHRVYCRRPAGGQRVSIRVDRNHKRICRGVEWPNRRVSIPDVPGRWKRRAPVP